MHNYLLLVWLQESFIYYLRGENVVTTQSVTVLDNEASFSIVNGMHAVFDYSQVMWLPWNQIKPFYLKKTRH